MGQGGDFYIHGDGADFLEHLPPELLEVLGQGDDGTDAFRRIAHLDHVLVLLTVYRKTEVAGTETGFLTGADGYQGFATLDKDGVAGR